MKARPLDVLPPVALIKAGIYVLAKEVPNPFADRRVQRTTQRYSDWPKGETFAEGWRFRLEDGVPDLDLPSDWTVERQTLVIKRMTERQILTRIDPEGSSRMIRPTENQPQEGADAAEIKAYAREVARWNDLMAALVPAPVDLTTTLGEADVQRENVDLIVEALIDNGVIGLELIRFGIDLMRQAEAGMSPFDRIKRHSPLFTGKR